MAQPHLLQIKLSRFDAQPWGFRLQGGVDFAAPLLVQKVNGGSLAEQAGLEAGDAVISINDVDVFNLTHKAAQDVVVRSGNTFVMTIQRGGSTWRPHVTPTGNMPQPNSPYLQTVTKTSLAHKQQESQHIGCGYNNAARPFANGGDGNVKSIVNKQYNTPVGIYSDESIAETLSAQAEVLAGGVLGVNFKKNEREYQADKSEVLKFLREEETGQTISPTPAYNQDPYHQHQQQQHQQQQQQQHQHQQQYYQQQSPATRHVHAPINTPKPPSTGGLPTGQNICQECERLITGVFVRIKDRNLHVECFKCATCGTSLKNQGYYNFNNKLYCEIHAKLAALQNPPPGTEGYVPVPIKPNTKLSANTVSAALNAHGYKNGVSNGSSTPTPSAPAEDNNDLPLPPPPSPTQLQQLQEFDNDNHVYSNTNANNHTRTNSSLSSMSTGSTNSSSLSPIPTHKNNANGITEIAFSHNNNKNSTATSSSSSLDRYGSLTSPVHSRQASSSSSSLTGGINFNVNLNVNNEKNEKDVFDMPTPPPLPPPLPLANPPTLSNEETILYINANKKNENNQRNVQVQQQKLQNENDMNMQNKGMSSTMNGSNTTSNNAYNKLLKEYSNKLLTQNNNHNNNNKNINNNNNCTNTIKHDSNISNSTDLTNKTEADNTATDNYVKKLRAIHENYKTNSSYNNNKSNNINKPYINNNSNKLFNGIAKPFTPTKQQTQPPINTQKTISANPLAIANNNGLATSTATNANYLKFNSNQVQSPLASTSAVASASATASTIATATNSVIPQVPALPKTIPPPPPPQLPQTNFSETLVEQKIDNSSSASNIISQCISGSNINSSKMSSSLIDDQPIYGQINGGSVNNNATLANQSMSNEQDKPFEYVTLTGNVIRSVVPPGKGVNINYKVNQGYARPFGASAGPPASAPKSPISYPPQQQQQWSQPSSNPYATLPRTNAGQQGRNVHVYSNYNNTYHHNLPSSNYSTHYIKPKAGPSKYATLPLPKTSFNRRSTSPYHNNYYNNNTSYYNYNYNYNKEPNTNTQANLQTHTKPANAGNTNINVNAINATLPRKPSLPKMTYHSPADLHNAEDNNATAMLTESIGKLEMGNKMNNFMSEAGKIISNMLEARLANNISGNPNMKTSYTNSPGSIPAISHGGSTPNIQNIGNSNTNLASRSPMVVRKRLDLDDFKNIDPTQPVKLQPVIAVQQAETNFKTNSQKAQPQIPKGSVNSTKMMTSNMPLDHPMSKLLDICDNKTTAAIASAPAAPLTTSTLPKAATKAIANSNVSPQSNTKPTFSTNIIEKKAFSSPTQEKNDLPMAYKPVVYRNKDSSGDTNRSGRSIHAFDRRSYIEPTPQNEETIKDGPVFSISVKALGGPNSDPNLPMAPENEEVVSQLLKDGKKPICCQCDKEITSGPFITALGRIWCPDHFICVNGNCRRPLQDIGFVEEKGDLYCEYCFEKYLAPTCSKCCGKIKGDCLNAIGRHFHPECFNCAHCGKLFGNTPFFLEDGNPYCEADWNELFTTKCFACGFPVEAGDRWVEALNHNYHSQCFNCTFCKQNLEGQSFYNKGGRPFCKNHAR